MKLLRFMSNKELNNFMVGNILCNDTDWSSGISKTNSRGFCFFPVGEQYDTPERRLSYASGVVSLDKAVIFETSQPLKKDLWNVQRSGREAPGIIVCHIVYSTDDEKAGGILHDIV